MSRRSKRRHSKRRSKRYRGANSACHAVFPSEFEWGSATAAFQIEGARGTRGDCIWDAFCDKGHAQGHSGNNACQHVELMREDVRRMKAMSLPYYRFSIAWARVWPDGTAASESEEGVRFYRTLLALLRDAGIRACVTLYHWDLPSALQCRGGWLHTESPLWFHAFAKRCFALFDEGVHRWITLNEPWCVAALGYGSGTHAPGDTRAPDVFPYRVAHHLLLGHAFAYHEYKDTGGTKPIGITLNAEWPEPWDRSCVAACERHLAFTLGWFADPIFGSGDYPCAMRRSLGRRLPRFSDVETRLLRGSSDFFGINWYTARMCAGADVWNALRAAPSLVKMAQAEPHGILGSAVGMARPSYFSDIGTVISHRASWPLTHMSWPVAPFGFARMLLHIQRRYPCDGGIVVTENGVAVQHEGDGRRRMAFLRYHLLAMHRAMRAGADVRGYYLWSLLDNFEWAYGYGRRFGAFAVDYATMRRIPRPVVAYYRDVIRRGAVEDDPRFSVDDPDFRVSFW